MRLDVFVRLAFLLYYYITSIYEEMCLSIYLLYIYSIESRHFHHRIKTYHKKGELGRGLQFAFRIFWVWSRSLFIMIVLVENVYIFFTFSLCISFCGCGSIQIDGKDILIKWLEITSKDWRAPPAQKDKWPDMMTPKICYKQVGLSIIFKKEIKSFIRTKILFRNNPLVNEIPSTKKSLLSLVSSICPS